MTTTDAMTKALSRKSVKRKYNAATIRSIRKRLKDGKLTLDFQVAFLSANGFNISKPMTWKKNYVSKPEPLPPTQDGEIVVLNFTIC